MQTSWRLSKILRQSSTHRRETHTANMTRSYADAVAALNTLQSNFAVVNAIRKTGKGMNKQAIPEMIDWCRKIGYEVRALASPLYDTWTEDL